MKYPPVNPTRRRCEAPGLRALLVMALLLLAAAPVQAVSGLDECSLPSDCTGLLSEGLPLCIDGLCMTECQGHWDCWESDICVSSSGSSVGGCMTACSGDFNCPQHLVCRDLVEGGGVCGPPLKEEPVSLGECGPDSPSGEDCPRDCSGGPPANLFGFVLAMCLLLWTRGRRTRTRCGARWPLALLVLVCLALTACGKGGGAEERDCTASCRAFNDNQPGHEWVTSYADGPGFKAFEACIADLAKRGKYHEGQCTAKGLAACTGACERANR